MPLDQPAGRATAQLHLMVPLVERQHALIEHLRARHPRFTSTAQLADHAGVSRRTVERDLGAMKAAGLPIQTRMGSTGGYRIPGGSAACTVTFSTGEVSALLAALVAVGPFSSATAQSAFAKLAHAIAEPAAE